MNGENKLEYLPLGSIVVVNGSVKKYVIIARGLQLNVKGSVQYFDYGACMYPEGLMGDQVMYFQHSNINKVVFKGFSDEDDKMMVDNINLAYQKQGYVHADTEELKKLLEN